MKRRVNRPTKAGRLVAALLVTTCLTPILLAGGVTSARADGGRGGSILGNLGGASGSDSATATGGTGGGAFIGNAGGGGGGAGATGGAGGAGGPISGGGAAGGPGAATAGGAGVAGDAATDVSLGGGGGGGGAHGAVFTTSTGNAGATGGAGGAGGNGGSDEGAGGGGGAAGWGVVIDGSILNYTMTGTAQGGTGGAGGAGGSAGFPSGGNGGSGGIGVAFTGGGSLLLNSGTIAGGNGGAGGTGSFAAGVGGAGGVGVTGSGLTVVNSGAISGGFANNGSGAQANAITFTAGAANYLILVAGSNISGNVVAASGNGDTLMLGGSTNFSFDVSTIGAAAQYRNFANFVKNDTSIWTLEGTTTAVTPWTITSSTLRVSQDGNLGDASGTLTIGNAFLETTATFSTARGVVLNNTATITPAAGTNLTLDGTVSGSLARLVKTGGGTLTLSGINTYDGGTAIVVGTIAINNGSALGTGAVELGGGALRSTANVTLANDITLTAASTVSAATGTTLNLTPSTSFLAGIGSSLTFGSSTDTGTVVLSIPAFVTGPASVTVAGGTLRAGNADFGLTPFATTTVNTGATLDLAGFGLTTNSLQGAGTVATGSTAGQVLAVNGGDFGGAITGAGQLLKVSSDGLVLSGTHSYTGGTTVDGGTLGLGVTGGASARIVGTIQVNSGFGVALNIINADTSGITLIDNNALVRFLNDSTAGSVTILTNAGATTQFSDLSTGGNALLFTDVGGTVDFSGSAGPAGLNQLSAGSIAGGGTYFLGANQLTVGGNNSSTTVSGTIEDGGSFGGGGASLVKTGTGTLTLSGNNTYTGGTTITGGLINFAAAGNFGTGTITLNGGGLQWATGNTTDISSRLAALGAGGGTFDTNGNNVTLAGNIGGAGGLTKAGLGTLILSGNNNYSGGTTVSGGILQGNTLSLQGNILNNANVTFDQGATGTYGGVMSGTGSLTKSGVGLLILSGTNSYSGGTTVSGGILQGNTTSLQGNILNNASVVFNQTSNGTYAGAMSGTGSMTLQGGATLTLTGNSSYTGATTVNASNLVVNGSLASIVTLNSGSMLGGSGTIGGLVANGAILAPGNSIGTLNIAGNFAQTGGIYQVEANAQGQSDRINAGGTATINGATVQLVAAPGSYGTSTTYTILNATGGVSGTYSGVSSNFAFLTPSLTYNANNVFLTLALQGNAFSGFGGNTVNQRAVGSALDQTFATASGDFATVIGALVGLNTRQGPWALNQISGQPYADFGSFNVANNALFMNTLGQQMALARGGSGSGQRQALAEACDVSACDGASPFSVWGSVLGGVGSVQGDGNSSAFTYNVGGAAAGIDYRLSPSFLVGLGTGYSNGTQWVDSFQGKGWSNSVSVAAYASFTQWGLYLDALAGYAYSNNQLQRQISIPGLQPRTANGSTGANQFLAQAEAGYKIGLYAPAAATVTPFARFQTSSINQAAVNEWGANSLSLNVQQQTTTSVRTVLGADLGGAIGLGDTRTLDLGLRLGWLHEYANTARPITAAFAGAPSASFTVYGATPQRDAAVIGFQASTNVAAATQIFLRYDGDIGSGTDNHALNVGVRVSW